MQKKETAKKLRVGTVEDSPYTQRVKNKNHLLIESIRADKAGPFGS